jgi:hypothetical protein
MDATSEPEKAQNTGDSAQGRNAAASSTPQIDSPSLVPGQGEPVMSQDTAEPMMTSGTALVITAFEPRRERAADTEPTPEQKRWRLKNWRATKFSSLAAALALAVGVGAISGAVGALGLQRALTDDTTGSTQALKESVVRLTSEFTAFKASVEAANKTASGQVQKIAERLDRADRAQVEPATRLAKLADAVDKLEKRAQGAPATIPATSPVVTPRVAVATPPDVTGSINAAAGKDPAKDVSRLPVVPGWILHSVYGGTAIVQGRMGLVEIEVGDPLPGGGRVEAIRRENGRWIVITSRGLILAR